jgi:hypothetical protein
VAHQQLIKKKKNEIEPEIKKLTKKQRQKLQTQAARMKRKENQSNRAEPDSPNLALVNNDSQSDSLELELESNIPRVDTNVPHQNKNSIPRSYLDNDPNGFLNVFSSHIQKQKTNLVFACTFIEVVDFVVAFTLTKDSFATRLTSAAVSNNSRQVNSSFTLDASNSMLGNAIINQIEVLKMYIGNSQFPIDDAYEYISEEITDGTFFMKKTVQYSVSSNHHNRHNFVRSYVATNRLSRRSGCQNFKRAFRNVLLHKNHTDFDLVSCYPNFLWHLIQLLNCSDKMPKFEEYIRDRNNLLEKLTEKYNGMNANLRSPGYPSVSTAFMKQKILALINGGAVASHLNPRVVGKIKKDKSNFLNFLWEFKAEIGILSDIMMNTKDPIIFGYTGADILKVISEKEINASHSRKTKQWLHDEGHTENDLELNNTPNEMTDDTAKDEKDKSKLFGKFLHEALSIPENVSLQVAIAVYLAGLWHKKYRCMAESKNELQPQQVCQLLTNEIENMESGAYDHNNTLNSVIAIISLGWKQFLQKQLESYTSEVGAILAGEEKLIERYKTTIENAETEDEKIPMVLSFDGFMANNARIKSIFGNENNFLQIINTLLKKLFGKYNSFIRFEAKPPNLEMDKQVEIGLNFDGSKKLSNKIDEILKIDLFDFLNSFEASSNLKYCNSVESFDYDRAIKELPVQKKKSILEHLRMFFQKIVEDENEKKRLSSMARNLRANEFYLDPSHSSDQDCANFYLSLLNGRFYRDPATGTLYLKSPETGQWVTSSEEVDRELSSFIQSVKLITFVRIKYYTQAELYELSRTRPNKFFGTSSGTNRLQMYEHDLPSDVTNAYPYLVHNNSAAAESSKRKKKKNNNGSTTGGGLSSAAGTSIASAMQRGVNFDMSSAGAGAAIEDEVGGVEGGGAGGGGSSTARRFDPFATIPSETSEHINRNKEGKVARAFFKTLCNSASQIKGVKYIMYSHVQNSTWIDRVLLERNEGIFCFKNGYYNFKSGSFVHVNALPVKWKEEPLHEFTEESLVPNIYRRVSYSYNERSLDMNKVSKLENLLKSFFEEDLWKVFATFIAKTLAGDMYKSKIILGLFSSHGQRNAGKTTLITFILRLLESYALSFPGEHIVKTAKRDTTYGKKNAARMLADAKKKIKAITEELRRRRNLHERTNRTTAAAANGNENELQRNYRQYTHEQLAEMLGSLREKEIEMGDMVNFEKKDYGVNKDGYLENAFGKTCLINSQISTQTDELSYFAADQIRYLVNGGDIVTYKQMYAKSKAIKLVATILFAGNHQPSLDDEQLERFIVCLKLYNEYTYRRPDPLRESEFGEIVRDRQEKKKDETHHRGGEEITTEEQVEKEEKEENESDPENNDDDHHTTEEELKKGPRQIECDSALIDEWLKDKSGDLGAMLFYIFKKHYVPGIVTCNEALLQHSWNTAKEEDRLCEEIQNNVSTFTEKGEEEFVRTGKAVCDGLPKERLSREDLSMNGNDLESLSKRISFLGTIPALKRRIIDLYTNERVQLGRGFGEKRNERTLRGVRLLPSARSWKGVLKKRKALFQDRNNDRQRLGIEPPDETTVRAFISIAKK